ncbi:GTP-binding protein Rho1, partial [Serendipita sp. 400]
MDVRTDPIVLKRMKERFIEPVSVQQGRDMAKSIGQNPEPQPRKLVVTGTWSSGKTCLLFRYCTNDYQYIDIPRTMGNVKMNFSIFSRLVTLDLWDKQLFRCDWDDGQRPLFYTSSSVVILCFGIDNPDSLLDVKEVWMPEVRLYTQAPILLVGCKMDIRTDTVVLEKMRTRYENMEPVSVQQ